MTTYRERLKAGVHTAGSSSNLKEQLKAQGLPTTGNKDEQTKRLEQAAKKP